MNKFSRVLLLLAVLACLAVSIRADLFLHGCIAGTNNKLNEQSNTRDTQRRMFNSQNGNNGGYNAITDPQAPVPFYYVGSIMSLYWTSQHGGGPNGVTKGDIVVQLMCGNYDEEFFGYIFDLDAGAGMRDGTTTTKVQETPVSENDLSVGMNEPLVFYTNCTTRERNRGLFNADRNLGNNADSTIQNNNGDADDNNRGAFECPEERDYYPYWHPTTFMDVAFLTRDTSQCRFIRKESQNVKTKNLCVGAPEANNEDDCAAAGGSFTEVTSWRLPPPDCLLGPFTETNHLGFSSQNDDETTYLASYNWTVTDAAADKCVLRMRYNMTQAEINRSDLDSRFNGDNSPVSQDPSTTVASAEFPNHPLDLAINSNQFPRTFEDRSHIFSIIRRPNSLNRDTIFNLGVIGKRGALQNIFPGMENDFCPKYLTITRGDSVHFQIYGPNTGTANGRNNGAGGDNRADTRGNRHNIVQISTLDSNFPLSIDKTTMFENRETAVFFAYGGQDPQSCVAGQNGETDPGNCGKINTPANGYFQHPPVRFNQTGVFAFMSSRNNINTNRDQKGQLTVAFGLPVAGLIFIILGSVVVVAGAGVGVLFYSAKRNPVGRAAQIIQAFKSKAAMRY